MRRGGGGFGKRRARPQAAQVPVIIVKRGESKRQPVLRLDAIADFAGNQFLRFKRTVAEERNNRSRRGAGLLIDADIVFSTRGRADGAGNGSPDSVTFMRRPEQSRAR